MPTIDLRSIIDAPGQFPTGDNTSDTVISGVHYNLTALNYWNYTLYSNGTLSNGSWCILTFPPYAPSLLYPNGTFANVTWCYSAINPIGLRGSLGIGFAVAFGLALVLTLMVLRKHGKLYLPAQKRFYPIGRRWQFYWALFTCAAAIISLFTNIDVDRYYLPELPIVVASFFWFLMQQGAMAVVWEAVRHWGSWQERQHIDPDPFALRQDDHRAKVEFWLPLWFYLWLWMNFFLIVPRNWGELELQRYPEQILTDAKPSATDSRFRAAAFFLVICWATIAFSLWHSIRHYKPRNRGIVNRSFGLLRFTPFRFQLLLPLALAIVAYQALVAWEWAYSPLNVAGDRAAIFAGGYAPALLIVVLQIAFGFANPNEDRELLRQRRARGDAVDRELGIVHKPAWWRRAATAGGDGDSVHGGEGMRDRIARHVRELGGGRATARKIDATISGVAAQRERDAAREVAGPHIEMDEMRRAEDETHLRRQASSTASTTAAGLAPGWRRQPSDTSVSTTTPYGGKSDRRRTERTMAAVAGLLFPTAEGDAAAQASRREDLLREGPPPYPHDRGRSRDVSGGGEAGADRPGTAGRSNSAETTNSITRPPQQIRSMLDV